MLKPEPGQACNCGQLAIGFHPYCGFACADHIRQAQADFSAISDGHELEVYGAIRKLQTYLRTETRK